VFVNIRILFVSGVASGGLGLGAAGLGRHFKGGGTSLTKNLFLKGV